MYLFFLLSFFSPALLFAEGEALEGKSVLYLNSYHKGYLWSDEVTSGIEERLSHTGIDLHIEYLDTKRIFDESYQALLAGILEYKHKNQGYDLVITSDDNANDFFRRYGPSVFGEIPHVFCGLNYMKRDEYSLLSLSTGINEKGDIDLNINLIQQLFPQTTEILLITDETTTGQKILNEVESYKKLKQLSCTISVLYDVSVRELGEALRDLKPGTVVLLTVFSRDKTGQFLEFDRGASFIAENSPVPVFALWSFSLGHGVLGGYLVDGKQQGRDAAEKALMILKGTSPSEIPVLWNTETTLKFDYRQLERWGLKEKDIPSGSEILYRPRSFYQENRVLIWNLAVAFFLILMALFAVSFGLFRVRSSALKLSRSEERLEMAMDASNSGIWDSNLQDGSVHYDDRYYRLAGYEPGDFPENFDEWEKRLHPDDLEHTKTLMNRYLSGESRQYSAEFRYRCRDGSYIWVRGRGKIVQYDENQNPVRIVGTHSDISGLKKAEEKLINLQEYLSCIIDSMPSVIIGIDPDYIITRWNTMAEKASGIKAPDALGKHLVGFFPHIKPVLPVITESLKTLQTRRLIKRARQTQKGVIYEDFTIFPLSEGSNEGAVLRIDDVTEMVHMEELMIQSEKMLSIGGLAAGMAHEINNPLAGMMQTAEVVGHRLCPDSKLAANRKAAEEAGVSLEAVWHYMELRRIPEMLQSIHESGVRAAGIVSNMLSFARKDGSAASTHDLHELIDATIELAYNDYDLKKKYDFRKISIDRVYGHDIPRIICHGSKIQQVLLNLLRNGAEAMQEGGIDNPVITIRTLHEGSAGIVLIVIEDNGPGMDELTRKRIFEPFYTTKGPAKGTGLGLSVSYFIIKEDHGGEMTVESTPGKGSKFTIYLPLQ